MSAKDHWEQVYVSKPAEGVSWFQERSEESLRLIKTTGLAPNAAAIIDVGGGASRLVDDLLAGGYDNLTVLDLSAAALGKTWERLGVDAHKVRWLEGDITRVELPAQAYEIWHDRAVFHFLIQAADRQAYIQAALRALKPGGHLIVATFAEDGPEKCSGLSVARYSPAALQQEFGAAFKLIEHSRELHRTPFGTEQKFIYCHCRKA